MTEQKQEDLPPFDANFSPANPQNKKAAEARRLHYRDGYYRDEDGSLIADRFGQPL